MGIMKRKCNKACCDYRKKIKKAIYTVAELMPKDFTDECFVENFKFLYPNLWDDLDKQHKYWKSIGQKFDNPSKFVLKASNFCRKKVRNTSNENSMDMSEIENMKSDIREKNLRKFKKLSFQNGHPTVSFSKRKAFIILQT